MDDLEQDTKLLEDLMAFSGLSAAAMAKKAGVNPSTLQRPLSGTATTRLGRRALTQLRDAFPHFPGWLGAPVVADKQLSYRYEGRTDPNAVAIAEIDAAYGMGSTFLDDTSIEAQTINFDRRWLRKYTSASPSEVFFARGIGDSMQGTLLDSDILLIDTSQRSMRSNELVWAITYGDLGMIKRLRAQPDGSILVMSDNPAIPPFTANDGELHIIGRVVAFERKL